MRLTKVLTKNDIEEVLENPREYVDETFDLPLVEIVCVGCRVQIMIGRDEYNKRYYLVAEDDEVFQDYYLNDDETLVDKFNWLLDNITESDPFPSEMINYNKEA